MTFNYSSINHSVRLILTTATVDATLLWCRDQALPQLYRSTSFTHAFGFGAIAKFVSHGLSPHLQKAMGTQKIAQVFAEVLGNAFAYAVFYVAKEMGFIAAPIAIPVALTFTILSIAMIYLIPHDRAYIESNFQGIKTTYDGEVYRGKPHGLGVWKSQDGYVFEGRFENGCPYKGTYRFTEGKDYSGYWLLDEPNDQSTIYDFVKGTHQRYSDLLGKIEKQADDFERYANTFIVKVEGEIRKRVELPHDSMVFNAITTGLFDGMNPEDIPATFTFSKRQRFRETPVYEQFLGNRWNELCKLNQFCKDVQLFLSNINHLLVAYEKLDQVKANEVKKRLLSIFQGLQKDYPDLCLQYEIPKKWIQILNPYIQSLKQKNSQAAAFLEEGIETW